MIRTKYIIDYGEFSVPTFNTEMAERAIAAGRSVKAITGDGLGHE